MTGKETESGIPNGKDHRHLGKTLLILKARPPEASPPPPRRGSRLTLCSLGPRPRGRRREPPHAVRRPRASLPARPRPLRLWPRPPPAAEGRRSGPGTGPARTQHPRRPPHDPAGSEPPTEHSHDSPLTGTTETPRRRQGSTRPRLGPAATRSDGARLEAAELDERRSGRGGGSKSEPIAGAAGACAPGGRRSRAQRRSTIKAPPGSLRGRDAGRRHPDTDGRTRARTELREPLLLAALANLLTLQCDGCGAYSYYAAAGDMFPTSAPNGCLLGGTAPSLASGAAPRPSAHSAAPSVSEPKAELSWRNAELLPSSSLATGDCAGKEFVLCGLPHEIGQQTHSREPGTSIPGGTPCRSLLAPQGAGGSRREPEPSVHGTDVPKRRVPRTGMRRKGRKLTGRVELAPNTSWSAPKATLPPEDADQLTTGQRLPCPRIGWARRLAWEPEHVPCAIDASQLSSTLAPLAGPELEPQEPTAEPSSPRIGWARRLAWEPEHVPCAIDASQLSSTLVGRVLHHLVQEEHLGPTVAELEDLRQMHLAPETRGGPTSWLEPVQELPETPVLERRPVSPASAPAEPEDVPAEASAQGPGPELEPHEPSGLGPRALARMAPGVAEPVPDPEPTSPSAASPWDITGVVSGPELEPHESSGTGPMAPAGMAQGRAEPQVVLEPTSPCTVSTRDLPKEEEQTILAFAPRLVAEQLTLMCAELYSRVERGECKVYVERHPLRESIVLLNPNILNVIKHFGTTFHFVISSCLGGPSTTAQDRARVVEFWIQVAKECLALRNFGSFRAIIVALQHPHVRRLENTWGHVSWKSSWIYRKLKKRNKGLKGKQLLEDARAIVRKWHQSPRASQDMKKQGMIPPLALILYDALEKQQEHHVDVTDFVVELLTYKFLARQYDLEPKEHFLSFFRRVKLLHEDQSYGLSCQLEPPGQRAGRKGLFKCFRSLRI
ncbi:uncharacterized protein [Manis javanica]|uniref:uncharacterized protein n=2 Tax=Manis javanica TaxID=9974 RepID=UPI003C6D0FC8